MPTLKNLSYGSLTIERQGGDPVTLGPRQTAEISDEDFDSAEIQRHLRDRRVAAIGPRSTGGGGGASAGSTASTTPAAPAPGGGKSNTPPTPPPAEGA